MNIVSTFVFAADILRAIHAEAAVGGEDHHAGGEWWLVIGKVLQ